MIPVWDTKEAVANLASSTPRASRVIWHPSDGSPDQEVDVSPLAGDTVAS